MSNNTGSAPVSKALLTRGIIEDGRDRDAEMLATLQRDGVQRFQFTNGRLELAVTNRDDDVSVETWVANQRESLKERLRKQLQEAAQLHVSSVLPLLTKEDFVEAVACFNEHGGILTRPQFVEMVEAIFAASALASVSLSKHAGSLFDTIDVDGDGVLSLSEFEWHVLHSIVSAKSHKAVAKGQNRAQYTQGTPVVVTPERAPASRTWWIPRLHSVASMAVKSHSVVLQFADPSKKYAVVHSEAFDRPINCIADVPHRSTLLVATPSPTLVCCPIAGASTNPLVKLEPRHEVHVLAPLTTLHFAAASVDTNCLFAATLRGHLLGFVESRLFVSNDMVLKPDFCISGAHDGVITALVTTQPTDYCNLFSGDFDGRIVMSDVGAGKVMHEFPIQTVLPPGVHRGRASIRGMLLHDTSRILVSWGAERVLRLWAPNSNQAPLVGALFDTNNPHAASITNCVELPNTPHVISLDASGVAKVWDLRMYACVDTHKLAFVEDLDAVNNFSVLSSASSNEFSSLGLVIDPSTSVCYAVSSNKDSTSYGSLVPVVPPTEMDGVAHSVPVGSPLLITWNPKSRHFITAAGRNVRLWDATTGSIALEVGDVVADGITAFCINETGKRFFVGTHDGAVTSHVVATGSTGVCMCNHDGEVTGLAYNPQFTLLVSISLDGVVMILPTDLDGIVCAPSSVNVGSPLLCLSMQTTQYVVVGDSFGVVRVIDCVLGKLISAVCMSMVLEKNLPRPPLVANQRPVGTLSHASSTASLSRASASSLRSGLGSSASMASMVTGSSSTIRSGSIAAYTGTGRANRSGSSAGTGSSNSILRADCNSLHRLPQERSPQNVLRPSDDSSVTAVLMLHPLPVFAFGENNGSISLWGCKPSYLSETPLFHTSIGEHDRDGNHASVTALEWYSHHNMLVVSDESGWVYVYDMTSVLSFWLGDRLKTGANCSAPHDSPSVAHSREEVAVTLRRLHAGGQGAIAELQSRSAPLLKSWRAHDCAVTVLYVLQEQGVIVTGSSTFVVTLWSTSGKQLGLLKQSRVAATTITMSDVTELEDAPSRTEEHKRQEKDSKRAVRFGEADKQEEETQSAVPSPFQRNQSFTFSFDTSHHYHDGQVAVEGNEQYSDGSESSEDNLGLRAKWNRLPQSQRQSFRRMKGEHAPKVMHAPQDNLLPLLRFEGSAPEQRPSHVSRIISRYRNIVDPHENEAYNTQRFYFPESDHNPKAVTIQNSSPQSVSPKSKSPRSPRSPRPQYLKVEPGSPFSSIDMVSASFHVEDEITEEQPSPTVMTCPISTAPKLRARLKETGIASSMRPAAVADVPVVPPVELPVEVDTSGAKSLTDSADPLISRRVKTLKPSRTRPTIASYRAATRHVNLLLQLVFNLDSSSPVPSSLAPLLLSLPFARDLVRRLGVGGSIEAAEEEAPGTDLFALQKIPAQNVASTAYVGLLAKTFVKNIKSAHSRISMAQFLAKLKPKRLEVPADPHHHCDAEGSPAPIDPPISIPSLDSMHEHSDAGNTAYQAQSPSVAEDVPPSLEGPSLLSNKLVSSVAVSPSPQRRPVAALLASDSNWPLKPSRFLSPSELPPLSTTMSERRSAGLLQHAVPYSPPAVHASMPEPEGLPQERGDTRDTPKPDSPFEGSLDSLLKGLLLHATRIEPFLELEANVDFEERDIDAVLEDLADQWEFEFDRSPRTSPRSSPVPEVSAESPRVSCDQNEDMKRPCRIRSGLPSISCANQLLLPWIAFLAVLPSSVSRRSQSPTISLRESLVSLQANAAELRKKTLKSLDVGVPTLAELCGLSSSSAVDSENFAKSHETVLQATRLVLRGEEALRKSPLAASLTQASLADAVATAENLAALAGRIRSDGKIARHNDPNLQATNALLTASLRKPPVELYFGSPSPDEATAAASPAAEDVTEAQNSHVEQKEELGKEVSKREMGILMQQHSYEIGQRYAARNLLRLGAAESDTRVRVLNSTEAVVASAPKPMVPLLTKQQANVALQRHAIEGSPSRMRPPVMREKRSVGTAVGSYKSPRRDKVSSPNPKDLPSIADEDIRVVVPTNLQPRPSTRVAR